jgi:hypothetical protein
MKLLKTKFKWNWKQNSNEIGNQIIEKNQTKLKIKFKRIWKWNSNEIKNKFKQNWKWISNEIEKEILFQTKSKQLAACAPKQVFVYGSG